MTAQRTQLILHTWNAVSTIDDVTVGTIFYNRLFEIAPGVRSLFKAPVPEQSKKLMAMLHYLIRNLHKPAEISASLANLAQRHAKYNVQAEHYTIVGEALLYTLEKGLGHLWNAEVREAWLCLYTHIANVMLAASETAKAA